MSLPHDRVHFARSASASLLASLLLVAACGDDDHPTDAAAPDGGTDGAAGDASGDAGTDAEPTCTTYLWDPDGEMTTFPDPSLVVHDPSTATGVRLHYDPARNPVTSRRGMAVLSVFTVGLADLDGFGVNAEAYFRFDRAFDASRLPDGDATTRPGAGIGFVVLSPGEPRLEGAIVRTTDEGSTLLLAPLHPLPARSTVAVYVTRVLTDAARGCFEPSSAMAARLMAPAGDDATAIDALRTLGAIHEARDLVALAVYPTQSTVDDSVAIAADIAARDYTVDAPPTCTTEPMWIKCDGTFTGADYRDPNQVVRIDAAHPVGPRATWRLPFSVWLPTTGTRPFRTILFGHGLGSGRDQAQDLAEFAAPRGYATVAIDAVMHGEHPSRATPATDTLGAVLSFFAIGETADQLVDALALRDHWRQSTYDKLQFTRLLQAGLDLDGDGVSDVDGDHLTYLGVSLGGIMGPELLALTDAYGAAVLPVPGARVASIVSDSRLIGPGLRLLAPHGTTEGDILRFIPVLQTVIDRGDSGSYGPHVLHDRLAPGGARIPSVLGGVALDDDTVPPVCNYALIRSLGLPLVPPELRHEPGIVLTAMPPVMGNFDDGAATAGFLQFDVVRRDDGSVQTAGHSNVPGSEPGITAWLDFLRSYWDDGLARIVDPYEEVGLMHASPGP